MATNIKRSTLDTIVIESVGAAYSANDLIVQGMLAGISLNDVDSGDDAVVDPGCEFDYAKAAGETWTEGDELFYDATHDRFSTTPTTDYIIRAYAGSDAVLAATTGDVMLCEGHYVNLAAATEYDNATSGLAATDVQAAIDEIDATVDGLGTDIMDLVGTPVAGNLIEMDATGQGVNSGLATADVQVLTVPAAAGNLASLGATGALSDSGVAGADVSGMLAVFALKGRQSTNTAQALVTATPTLIALEDADLVGGVTFDAGTNLFTIPAGGVGIYMIVYGATFAAGAGTYNQIAIKINGTTRSDTEETPDNANPIVVENGTVLRLAAGDTVGLCAKQDSGGALDVTSAYMAIQRIQ